MKSRGGIVLLLVLALVVACSAPASSAKDFSTVRSIPVETQTQSSAPEVHESSSSTGWSGTFSLSSLTSGHTYGIVVSNARVIVSSQTNGEPSGYVRAYVKLAGSIRVSSTSAGAVPPLPPDSFFLVPVYTQDPRGIDGGDKVYMSSTSISVGSAQYWVTKGPSWASPDQRTDYDPGWSQTFNLDVSSEYIPPSGEVSDTEFSNLRSAASNPYGWILEESHIATLDDDKPYTFNCISKIHVGKWEEWCIVGVGGNLTL